MKFYGFLAFLCLILSLGSFAQADGPGNGSNGLLNGHFELHTTTSQDLYEALDLEGKVDGAFVVKTGDKFQCMKSEQLQMGYACIFGGRYAFIDGKLDFTSGDSIDDGQGNSTINLMGKSLYDTLKVEAVEVACPAGVQCFAKTFTKKVGSLSVSKRLWNSGTTWFEVSYDVNP